MTLTPSLCDSLEVLVNLASTCLAVWMTIKAMEFVFGWKDKAEDKAKLEEK